VNTDERTARLALVALVLGAIAIGFAPIFVRLSELQPSATAFWRVALATPVFFIWLWIRTPGDDRRREPVGWRDHKYLILGGVLFAVDLAFWHWSLQFTTVANATLLSNLTPIVVAVGSVVLFRERLGGLFLMGLGLALVGAALLSGASFQIGDTRPLGDGLAIVTAFFYGSYLLAVGRLRGHYSTATIMAWTGLASAIALIPITILSGETFLPETLHGWLVLIGLAGIAQVLGQTLIAYALAHLPAAFGAVTLTIQPIVAAVAAWYIFAEVLGWLEFAGAVAILTGIVTARAGTLKVKVGRPDA
jgi:drug/metabolite transporter (DMT)-like permease